MKKEVLQRQSRSEWERLIDEWIFDEKTRKILKRRILDNVTIEDLATEFNFSVEGIKKRLYPAEKILFDHI